MEERIIVNGKSVLLKDYRKEMKLKNGSSKKTLKKSVSQAQVIKLLPKDVDAMIRKVKLIKSLNAYYDNGYRQWGTICSRLLSMNDIRRPFVQFRVKYRELEGLMSSIKEVSKRGSKDIYDFVRRLSYILEDITDHINTLGGAVSKNDFVTLHHDHECINGHGRRLGLKVLISRTFSSTQELKKIINDLQYFADEREWKVK